MRSLKVCQPVLPRDIVVPSYWVVEVSRQSLLEISTDIQLPSIRLETDPDKLGKGIVDDDENL